MKSREFVERAANYAYFAALALFAPAVVSLFFAVWAAASAGQVMVISLGRTHTAHEIVPWLAGWSRFASPLILVCAGLSFPSGTNVSTLRLLVFILLALTGIGTLCYSLWFTSLGGAFGFVLFSVYILFAYYVDQVFGRRPVLVLLVFTVAVLVHVYAVA